MNVAGNTPVVTPNPGPIPSPKDRALRERIGEFVGITFFGQMLRSMQNSSLKSDIGHGGRGEEVFAGQLYMELAQQAGRSQSSPLTEALYRQLRQGSRTT